MREISVLTFVTLDGIMQAPRLPDEDESGRFTHGGWAAPYWDEVMEHVGRNAFFEPYDALLGRSTYELFYRHQNGEGPLNDTTKYVVTSSTRSLPWKNSVAIRGDIPAEIAALKREKGRPLQVHGSWALVQLLWEHDLVDELRVWTFPVVVGTGKRLFEAATPPRRFALRRWQATKGERVGMSIYRRIEDTRRTT